MVEMLREGKSLRLNHLFVWQNHQGLSVQNMDVPFIPLKYISKYIRIENIIVTIITNKECVYQDLHSIVISGCSFKIDYCGFSYEF